MFQDKNLDFLLSNVCCINCRLISKILKLEKDNSLVKKLQRNTIYFREQMTKIRFDIIKGTHPIVSIMLYDAVKAKEMSEQLLKSVCVIGFVFQ